MKASHYDKLAVIYLIHAISNYYLFGSWSNLLLEAGIVTSDSLMSLPNLDIILILKSKDLKTLT